jgi:hypothetical protein
VPPNANGGFTGNGAASKNGDKPTGNGSSNGSGQRTGGNVNTPGVDANLMRLQRGRPPAEPATGPRSRRQ